MRQENRDYFYVGNIDVRDYELIYLIAAIVGLNFRRFPPLESTPDKHFCFAVDNKQVAEYRTFCKVEEMVKEEWKQKMLDYGAPKETSWYWAVECKIGMEKEYFSEKYPFMDDVSVFLNNCPSAIPIDWNKIIEFADNYKKEYKKNHPNEIYIKENKKNIKNKSNQIDFLKKSVQDDNFTIKRFISVEETCDGFNLDNL